MKLHIHATHLGAHGTAARPIERVGPSGNGFSTR